MASTVQHRGRSALRISVEVAANSFHRLSWWRWVRTAHPWFAAPSPERRQARQGSEQRASLRLLSWLLNSRHMFGTYRRYGRTVRRCAERSRSMHPTKDQTGNRQNHETVSESLGALFGGIPPESAESLQCGLRNAVNAL